MRADYKEIRLSTFNDALKRMEAIKETSDISSKVCLLYTSPSPRD